MAELVCPLCQTPQPPALECTVCGRDLRQFLGPLRPAPSSAPEPVPGLEVTVQPAAPDRPTGTLLDLEPSRHAAAGDPASQPLPDLEVTRHAEVHVPLAAPMPDFAPTRTAEPGPLTPLVEGPVTCRYCRNVQSSGLFCDRCGMRLPVVQVGVVVGQALRVEGRCKACGAPGVAGERCAECGAPVPFP